MRESMQRELDPESFKNPDNLSEHLSHSLKALAMSVDLASTKLETPAMRILWLLLRGLQWLGLMDCALAGIIF